MRKRETGRRKGEINFIKRDGKRTRKREELCQNVGGRLEERGERKRAGVTGILRATPGGELPLVACF